MKSKLSSYRWVIVTLVCLVCLMSNYIQFQISALATEIMPALGINQAQFASLLMAPFLVSVFIAVPGGALADRFGSKAVVGVGMFLTVIGAFGRLIAGNFALMMIMLMLTGFGGALVNACLIKLLGMWFKEDTGKAMGYFYASSCAGIVISQVTGSWFPSVTAAYMFSSVAVLVIAIAWVVLIKNAPEGEVLPPPEPTLEYLKVASKSKKTWIVSVLVGISIGTTTALAGIMPMAFVERGASMGMAGVIAAVATFGSFFGSLVGAPWIAKIGKWKTFLIVTQIIGGAVMYVTWIVPMGAIMWIVLFFNGFVSAISGPVQQAMPITFPEIGEKYAGSAGGLVGTVSMIISYILPIIVSSIVGDDFGMNFLANGILFAAVAIGYLMLPEDPSAEAK